MFKFFFSLIKYLIVISIWLLIILTFIFFYNYSSLPDVTEINHNKNNQTVEIKYNNNEKIIRLGDSYENQITYSQIPKNLIHAVIATEDRNFFNHFGFDIKGILRAFYVNLKDGKITQGGSTITQQLAKLVFLKPEKTIKRKVKEVILAIKIERIFSKEQILTLYLNHAYFGSGNYGIYDASQFYFNKDISNLNLTESAMLAGLLKAPSIYTPKNDIGLNIDRTKQVLKNMYNAGYLPYDEIEKNIKKLAYKTDKLQKLYFTDYVNKNFRDYLNLTNKKRKHFSIKTTLDKDIQNASEDVLDQFIKNNQKKFKNSQTSIIIMNYDGAILAMIGGNNYQNSQFNRSIYSKRQVGSTFKTFTYLTAFQEGFSPQDEFIDEKITLNGWSPKNYNDKYYGNVSLQEAFAKSLNSVAVKLYQEIDKNNLELNLEKLGIYSQINFQNASTALGTAQMSLFELVTAYTIIANGGFGIIPYSISEIKDQHGKLLYERKTSHIGKIFNDDSIKITQQILRDAVANGTGNKANINQYVHGKTGTSQNSQDLWFVGFDDKYVIGVWIGSDNANTQKMNNSSIAAQIFAKILTKI